MKVVKGNLLTLTERGDFDVVIHGCNCKCVMGAGIAGQIAKRWPEVATVDADAGSDSAKLGYYTSCRVERAGHTFRVINAYTQVSPGADARLDAVRNAFFRIARNQTRYPARIAYPMIGCGIGGLKWEDVAPIIDKALDGLDHTLVEWDGSP